MRQIRLIDPSGPRVGARVTARFGAAAALIVAATTLAGCTAEPPSAPDAAQVQAWSDAITSSVADKPGVLGVMTSAIDIEDDGAVTLNYEAPVTVSSIEISCFGEGTVTVAITVAANTASPSALVLNENEARCSDGVFTVDLSAEPRFATEIEVAGVRADRPGHWVAVVRGVEPSEG